MCGNGFLEENEECDCGTSEVSYFQHERMSMKSLIQYSNIQCTITSCVHKTCYRNAAIPVATKRPANLKIMLNVALANVVRTARYVCNYEITIRCICFDSHIDINTIIARASMRVN